MKWEGKQRERGTPLIAGLEGSGRVEGVQKEFWAGSPQGLLPGTPTDPDVRVKRIRFVTLWSRCPSHDWVVSR